MSEFLLKSPLFLGVWIMQLAVKVPTMLLGLVVVPFTYKYRNTPLGETPAILTPWINPEDWYGGFPGFDDSLPPFWRKREGTGRWSHYWYHAVRNPADGLRNYRFLNPIPDPGKMKYWTNEYRDNYEPWAPGPRVSWYFCWQGYSLGSALQIRWSDSRYLALLFGLRLNPGEAKGIRVNKEKLVWGASMATKLLPYRKYEQR